MEQQRAAAGVIAGDQGQVQVAAGHPRDERGRLLAVQLDLDPAVPRGEALEHRGDVTGGIVVGHPEPDPTGERLPTEGGLGLGVQVEHAPGVTQERLPVGRQLQMPWAAHQQLAPEGRFQLLQLHAHRGLRAMHLAGRARQRAGVYHRDEALEPVHLQIAGHHRRRPSIRYSNTCLKDYALLASESQPDDERMNTDQQNPGALGRHDRRHAGGALPFILGSVILGTIGIFVHEAGTDPLTATWFRCAFGLLGLTLWIAGAGSSAACVRAGRAGAGCSPPGG